MAPVPPRRLSLSQRLFQRLCRTDLYRSGHRFDDVPEMTPEQREAMQFSQSLSEELRFDTGFNRGDMQFCNNHVIFHTRRAFEDFEDPVASGTFYASG